MRPASELAATWGLITRWVDGQRFLWASASDCQEDPDGRNRAEHDEYSQTIDSRNRADHGHLAEINLLLASSVAEHPSGEAWA